MASGKDNRLASIMKSHRERIGRAYDRFTGKISNIRKRKLDSMKDESNKADETKLAELRKSMGLDN
jgi:hypothetical protein